MIDDVLKNSDFAKKRKGAKDNKKNFKKGPKPGHKKINKE